MNIKRLLIATSLLCASISMAATLKPDAPQHYVVQPGDSLWDIAKKYTDDPWEWRQLWKNNPQLANPNRIYPGDELSVVNGTIVYKRNFKASNNQQKGMRTVKLTPELREVPIELGLPVISYDYLRGKFVDMEIVSSEELKALPYIVGFEDNRLTGYTNVKAFVKGDLTPGKTYNVYERSTTHKGMKLDDIRKGKKKKDVEIGTELIKTGEVVVENSKDGVSTVYIKNIISRGLAASQLLIEQPPMSNIGNLYFEPKTAPQKTEAEIVGTPGMLKSVAVGGNVVLDKGLDAALSPGDLLLAQQADIFKNDPMNPSKRIRIPGQASGIIMIYKVFDRMSLGIVIESKKPIQRNMMAVTPYSDYITK
ncbi:LysM peptidoglycan-binding domain-containing protein [Wohlfahrtiimonas larvae]|uniref:LysM domain-containing protein n=1 Tax=Wohlfahrtiimonas larvae TaxID=1157986 RepID=A0ABP9MRD5_9GAMM|nr:LysM domain-containing protein [Wohlfahrtiimonas larvae]